MLLAAGSNMAGQLGVDVSGELTQLEPVRGLGNSRVLDHVMAVDGGGRHSLAVLSDGSVVAWGANDQGQLGDGSRRASAVPVRVSAADGAPGWLGHAVAVSADTDFSMALLRDGRVVTWGLGDAGQRGVGELTPALPPTTVRDETGAASLTGITKIAADGRTAYALRRDGTVWTWGSNKFGQLGDGTKQDRALPAPVRGVRRKGLLTGVVDIAVGGQHGVAVLRNGRMMTWGRNDFGQLGDGTHKDRPVPDYVRGPHGGVLEDVVQVDAAEKHNYARLRDGSLLGWGDNGAGQVGDGSLQDRKLPTPVRTSTGTSALREVVRVFAGEAYGAALLKNGRLLTWGAGGHGQLASGTASARSLPAEALMADGTPVTGVRAVGTGEQHLLLAALP